MGSIAAAKHKRHLRQLTTAHKSPFCCKLKADFLYTLHSQTTQQEKKPANPSLNLFLSDMLSTTLPKMAQ